MKIATLQLLIICLLCACQQRAPKTDTQAPSLDVAIYKTEQLQKNLSDGKESVGRIRTYSERIEYKASLIE